MYAALQQIYLYHEPWCGCYNPNMDEREELEKNSAIPNHFLKRETNGIGLALGGGLARGLAHIGVIKALVKEGVNPQIVAGTSIGAVVGGCHLTDKMAALEDWALSLTRKRVLSYLDFRVHSASLIGGQRLTKLLKSHLGDTKIETLDFPFAAVATNLLTGHEIWIQRGEIVEAMRASFALPGVFPPVERNHRLLADGALVNPLPVAPCQAMGARLTIAVDLNADLLGKSGKPGHNYQTVAGFDMFSEKDVSLQEQKKVKNSLTNRLFGRPNEHSPSLFGVMISSLGIMQDRLTRLRAASDPPDIHIKPQIGHIGLAEFERADELIAAGERAAYQEMSRIKEAMHLFLPYSDD